MERHLDVANVQDHGCGALNNVISGSGNITQRRRAAASAGAKAAIEAAKARHPDHADIQKWARKALNKLA